MFPHHSVLVQLMAGGTAGVIQWLPPIYYADVLKSHMQTAVPGQYNSMWDCAKHIYRTEGLRGYHRGLFVAILRAFPLHAVIFCGYETVMYLTREWT